MSSFNHRLQDQSGGSGPLDVRLSVAPPDECDCLPSDWQPSAVSQSLTNDGDGSWTCEMVLEEEDRCEYEQTEAAEACPCYLFSTHECVAELLDIRNGRLHYSVTIPDRSLLAPLVERLRDGGSEVSVYRILTAEEGEEDSPTLTDKQRETLSLAIESGYYDRPRKATLADIAEELDITTSAASQRLSSVKRRLIERYAEEQGPRLSE